MVQDKVSQPQRIQIWMDFGPNLAGQDTPEPTLLGSCMWVPSRRVMAFEWAQSFLEGNRSNLALSPLMLRQSPGVHLAPITPFDGLHGLFSDAIPDGFGRRLMDRGLYQAGIVNPTVTQRLSWVGDRGPGALVFRPSIDPSDTVLSNVVEAAQIAQRLQAEQLSNIPFAALRAGGTSNGARPKFWVGVPSKVLHEPISHAVEPSGSGVIGFGDIAAMPPGYAPCLLKFAPTGGDRHEPIWEATCMSLAREIGIDVPRGVLLPYKAGGQQHHALAIERFDLGADGRRVHVQSLAALLEVDFRVASLDYQALLRVSERLASLGREHGGTDEVIRQMLLRACFNVALHLRDDHAKNFSFCMAPDGRWSPSPAYDLCPAAGLGLTQEHTMTVLGRGKDIGLDDLITLGQEFSVSRHEVERMVDMARFAASKFVERAMDFGAPKVASMSWGRRMDSVAKSLQRVAISTDHSGATSLEDAKSLKRSLSRAQNKTSQGGG